MGALYSLELSLWGNSYEHPYHMFHEEMAVLKSTHNKGFHEEQTAMDLYYISMYGKRKSTSDRIGVVGIGRCLVEPHFQQKMLCLKSDKDCLSLHLL